MSDIDIFKKELPYHFIEWESKIFGYGYGTGEYHIIPAVKTFLELCPKVGQCYDVRKIEEKLTATVAWLLINTFCNSDPNIIEYGTSPRVGWLTCKGHELKLFMKSKTNDELIELLTKDNSDDVELLTANPFLT